MRFFRGDPTSITVSIDRLATMYEMEWFTFHHLVESIAMQEQGPKEALDVIQKRLKHGTCHQQLRLLEVLNYLVERASMLNHAVASPKLKSRLKGLVKSKSVDLKVKSHIVVLLEMWSRKYADQPRVAKFSFSIIQLGQTRGLDKSNYYHNDPQLLKPSDTRDPKQPKYTASLGGFSPFSRRYQNLSSHAYLKS